MTTGAPTMTRAQLIKACRLQDAANKKKADAEHAAELKVLVRALGTKGFRFLPWELEEMKRLVHGAFGRHSLKSR